MAGILRVKDLNRGHVLKQGDKTELSYVLYDADGDTPNLAGKPVGVVFMTPDFKQKATVTETTVGDDNVVSFTIDGNLPNGKYYYEFVVGIEGNQQIYPSEHRQYFTVAPSSLESVMNVIQMVGFEELSETIIERVQVNVDEILSQVEQAELDRQAQEEARVGAESTRETNEQDRLNKDSLRDDKVAQMEADKDAVIANATVDSEVILARGGKATLGQRLDETTAQLAQIGINVKSFGAMGDGVTDDTEAVKNAIAFACSFAKLESLGAGWHDGVPTVYFPAGHYVISEKKALNPTRSALKGYNVKGAGYLNTKIIYTYEGDESEEDDYLFYNGGNIWWGFSYVEDISFKGTNNNNIWAITSQAGSPQANRFRRVNFENVNECVTVKYGSRNVNADLFRFESCKAQLVYGWVFGVEDDRNSQSVVHTFRDCDFERIYGRILYFRSGGTVEVRGGSWIVCEYGRVIETNDPTQRGIGVGNNFFTFYGTKFEYIKQKLSEADDIYPLFYNHSMANITFENCNFGQFSAWDSVTNYYHFGNTNMGEINFNNCYIPRIMGIKVEVRGSLAPSGDKPKVFIRNSRLFNQLNDIVDIQFNDASYNVGNHPIVVAEGCVHLNLDPVNTVLNKHLIKNGYEARKNVFVYRRNVSSIDGIPNSNHSFKLPVGAILTDVKIVFQNHVGNGYLFNVEVTNFDGSETLVTATHTPTNPDTTYLSDPLAYVIDSEEKRNILINVETSSPRNARGFIMFEYY